MYDLTAIATRLVQIRWSKDMPARIPQALTKLYGRSRFSSTLNLISLIKLVTDGQMIPPRQRLDRRLHGLYVSGCHDTAFSGDAISLPVTRETDPAYP
jgi:hypothetical protein